MSLGNLGSPDNMHTEIPNQALPETKTEKEPQLHTEKKSEATIQKANKNAMEALHLDGASDNKSPIHDCHYNASTTDGKENKAFNQVATTAKTQVKSLNTPEKKAAFKESLAARTNAPPSFEKFQREIQMGSDGFAMNKLVRGLKAETSDSSFELPKLTVSQNPVAKVGGALFLPKSALTSPEVKVSDHNQALSKAMAQARLMKGAGFTAVDMLMPSLKKYSGCDKNSPDAVGVAKELANQCQIAKGKINGAQRRDPLLKEKDAIKNLDEIIKSLGAFVELEPLENMKTFYNKDELISQLNVNLSFAEFPEDKETIKNAIDIVNNENESFMPLSGDKGDLVKSALIMFSDKLSLPNVNEFASTVEFMKANSANEIKAADTLKNAEKSLGIQENTFAFKTGSENAKELLAGKLTSTLGLSSFLAPKEEHVMTNASLSGQVNPRGIASRFIEGSISFATDEFHGTLQAEHQLAVAKFKLSQAPEDKNLQEQVLNLSKELETSKAALLEKEFQSTLPTSFAPLAELKKCTTALNNATIALKKNPSDQKLTEDVAAKEKNLAEAKIKYEGAVSSLKSDFKGLSGVKEHVLTDLLFCAYDSHANQYMINNGSAVNIDFARFLAPCEVNEKNNDLFPTLRSGLFDHPASSEPLSASEIQKIQSWDIESIESQWKNEGLLGDSVAFKAADQKINEYYEDLDKATNKNHDLKELCLKYDIKTEDMPENKLREVVANKIKQEMETLREECFGKVHPEAFAAFKERVTGLQKYITECQNENSSPTLKGAFPSMYPKMAPFMKVVERLDSNPGSSISFAIKEGAMIQRSLRSIIIDAKKENLATNEEIQEMETAMESYKQIDARKTPLQTTMALR